MKKEKTIKGAKLLAGICGIYCGSCPFYLAPREDDKEKVAELAKEYNIPVDEMYCNGCLSDHPVAQCAACRHGFRDCAREHKVIWCFECADFPCERLEKHSKVHVFDGLPHHIDIIDNLRYMQQYGVEQWVKEKKKVTRCSQCGKRLYWYMRVCPQCGTQRERRGGS